MATIKPVGIVTDDRFFDHQIDKLVAESPARIRPLYRRLHHERNNTAYRWYQGQPLEKKTLHSIHSDLYLDQLRKYAVNDDNFAYDPDTYLMADSFQTASLAAGGCLKLAADIMAGEIDHGFALIRPPGHHAEAGQGMGFCILNNIALVAKYLKEYYDLKRICILDFDAHHCNGSQSIFYDDPEVMVISIHQENLFPKNSGHADDIGGSSALGYTINIPVPSLFGDLEYSFLFGRVIQELLDQFNPEIILVSAGFDGHADDSMNNLLLSTEWYHLATQALRSFAKRHCQNRLLYILEGGYKAQILEESVLACLTAMSSAIPSTMTFPYSPRAEELLANKIRQHLHKYWQI